jgi:hypothetical protein
MRLMLAGSLLMVLVGSNAFGQSAASPDSVLVGDFKLRLGMSQEAVLGGIAKDGFKATASDEMWVITSTAGVWGNISFTKGKLSYVLKNWGPHDQKQAVGFAKALFSVLASQGEGTKACIVDTSDDRQPNGEVREIILNCGGAKSIEISIISSELQPSEMAGVAEVMRSEK